MAESNLNDSLCSSPHGAMPSLGWPAGLPTMCCWPGLGCAGLTASSRWPWQAGALGVYLDIGANIGACIMTMLLASDAFIVAFEPNPANLFRLTSTLLKLEVTNEHEH